VQIRGQVTLLLALLFAALIAAEWSIEQQQIRPRFVALERESAHTDMQRVAMALEREQMALAAQAADWGNWADLWRYVAGDNPGFAEASLTDGSFKTARLDYMAVFGTDGRRFWRHGPYGPGGEILAVRLNASDTLEPGWVHALEKGEPIAGLIATDRGPMIAAGSPILDGVGGGPARGMVIMGRLLSEAELRRLGNQAQVHLDMTPWVDGRRTKPGPAGLTDGSGSTLSETDEATRIERTFGNRSGMPLVTLGITVPRVISQRGAEAVLVSTSMLAGAAGVVMLALYLLLSRTVFNPLGRVTNHAHRIARSDDLSARLNERRADEIGTLASAFDEMVTRLEESRRELADRSFESGIAENARGILHNLGNAMTPLSVRIAGMRSRIARVPFADLRRAFAELAQPGTDPERRRDLEEFVNLSGRETLRVLESCTEDLDAAASQASVIQAVLGEQRRLQRSGPVRQMIRPDELVQRSLQHIAASHRERLDVRQAEGLVALEALPLPSTTLGMVIANLAQNAAEAAAQAGISQVRIVFDASLEPHGTGLALRLVVADHGVGVAPEQMPMLFQKGYSTKSETTNSGLGLHWCANTLRGMGGSIAAHSDGPGRGLRFDIVVPLGEAGQKEEVRAA
jgi:sensor domain CHASE-containing protein/HAMP domain-containing protein